MANGRRKPAGCSLYQPAYAGRSPIFMEESMTVMRRRNFLLGLCGAACVAGCNFPSAMYFLMPEAKEPAEYKRLASVEDKKEIKVVLWTYMGLDPRPELAQADRQLAAKLAECLHRTSEENKEKVTIVKPSLVEQYKSNHPDWKSIDLEQVGHYFKADYVISLEIDQLSLYAPKAQQQLYQGRTHILVSLVDVKNPDETLQPKEFTDLYPGEERGGLDSFGTPVGLFKETFLTHVARRLSFFFVNHQKRDRVMVMDG